MRKLVKHPDFGYVIFTNPTSRQLDIIARYKKQEELINKYKDLLKQASTALCLSDDQSLHIKRVIDSIDYELNKKIYIEQEQE